MRYSPIVFMISFFFVVEILQAHFWRLQNDNAGRLCSYPLSVLRPNLSSFSCHS